LKKVLQCGWGRVNYRFEKALSHGVALGLGSVAIAARPTQASDRARSVRYKTGSASNGKSLLLPIDYFGIRC